MLSKLTKENAERYRFWKHNYVWLNHSPFVCWSRFVLHENKIYLVFKQNAQVEQGEITGPVFASLIRGDVPHCKLIINNTKIKIPLYTNIDDDETNVWVECINTINTPNFVLAKDLSYFDKFIYFQSFYSVWFKLVYSLFFIIMIVLLTLILTAWLT